jgi:hypothetical protein
MPQYEKYKNYEEFEKCKEKCRECPIGKIYNITNILLGKLEILDDNNQIYGFLDQDTFVNLSKNYKVTHIDRVYCDHTKKSHSSIVMTGKGPAKFEENFKQVIEKWKKYKV